MSRSVVAVTYLSVALLAAACASSGGSSVKPTSQPKGGAANYLPPGMDSKDPLAPTILMREGQALIQQGQIEEGMKRYRAALKRQPNNPTIHNLIGQAELRRGDNLKALAAFNEALALAPGYTDARNNRGAAYVALGQLAQAEADFLSALADLTYANRPGVLYNLGALYAARGSLTAAEENLRKAATPAGPVEAYVLLGQVQARLGKLEQAEESFRSAVDRAPERVDLAMQLARHLESVGRREEALALYRRIIDLGPGTPEAAEARAKLER